MPNTCTTSSLSADKHKQCITSIPGHGRHGSMSKKGRVARNSNPVTLYNSESGCLLKRYSSVQEAAQKELYISVANLRKAQDQDQPNVHLGKKGEYVALFGLNAPEHIELSFDHHNKIYSTSRKRASLDISRDNYKSLNDNSSSLDDLSIIGSLDSLDVSNGLSGTEAVTQKGVTNQTGTVDNDQLESVEGDTSCPVRRWCKADNDSPRSQGSMRDLYHEHGSNPNIHMYSSDLQDASLQTLSKRRKPKSSRAWSGWVTDHSECSRWYFASEREASIKMNKSPYTLTNARHRGRTTLENGRFGVEYEKPNNPEHETDQLHLSSLDYHCGTSMQIDSQTDHIMNNLEAKGKSHKHRSTGSSINQVTEIPNGSSWHTAQHGEIEHPKKMPCTVINHVNNTGKASNLERTNTLSYEKLGDTLTSNQSRGQAHENDRHLYHAPVWMSDHCDQQADPSAEVRWEQPVTTSQSGVEIGKQVLGLSDNNQSVIKQDHKAEEDLFAMACKDESSTIAGLDVGFDMQASSLPHPDNYLGEPYAV